MAASLWLTKDEQKIFSALSDALRDGWKVVEETQVYEDTALNQRIRVDLTELQSPVLKDLQERLKNAKSKEDFVKITIDTDISMVTEHDVSQLFFMLGPDAVTGLIKGAIENAKTDDDLSLASTLSELRHEMLASLIAANSD